MFEGNHQAIDAVVTWVDGQDPKHVQKLNAYIADIGGRRPVAADPTRFHNDGEITYCIISLLKYAPWLRYIHVVTDDQTPEIFNQLKGTPWEHKVRLVDHKDIFSGYEFALPTFNIRSIMTVLWRIPDLSERFLFLNDDFALIQPVFPQNFFYENGIVVRGQWRNMGSNLFLSLWRNLYFKLFPNRVNPKQRDRAKHRDAQKNSARLAGFTDKYFWLRHEPHPWRISTIKRFFDQNPNLFLKNLSPKLRSPDQFICESLAAFLEMQAGTAVIDKSLKAFKVDPAGQTKWRLKKMISRADANQKYAFVCVQSLEKGSPELRKYITDWLDRRIGSLDELARQYRSR
ncbi:MAG: capsular biosynthesis protein [Gammaproteobacteria bacterium]|nr:MAG: capsular biosynthesis protein [Gammaproteobacteria bacterium]